jgi:signal transduction protein with GAF and PtsI domain
MNHEAIYALYPTVKRIIENTPYDANDNVVIVDADAVAAWVSPEQYARNRRASYPSMQEQLDMQYWDSVNGTTTWKDAIAAVKTENPKP